MMPLALLGVGESGTITDIRGKEDVIHHLHNLGFAAGTCFSFMLSLHCKKEDAAASSFQISLFGSISPDRPGGSPGCR